MDSDGEDDYSQISKILDLTKKNKEIDVITVNRSSRKESFIFRILYEIHLTKMKSHNCVTNSKCSGRLRHPTSQEKVKKVTNRRATTHFREPSLILEEIHANINKNKYIICPYSDYNKH